MGTKIITQSEMQKRKFLAPVINQSATKRDVRSFLNKNNTAAKITLDFFDEYIKRCDQQNIKFRLDGGLKKYLRRWQYYWTVKNTPVRGGSLILDALVNLGGLLTGNGFLSFTFDYRKWSMKNWL